jgi:hypothetical protein
VVTASSSDPTIVPNPIVSYLSPNPSGSLSFTPVPNASGSAMITVTVDDGRITKVRGSDALPYTEGVICNKVARKLFVQANTFIGRGGTNCLEKVLVIAHGTPRSRRMKASLEPVVYYHSSRP